MAQSKCLLLAVLLISSALQSAWGQSRSEPSTLDVPRWPVGTLQKKNLPKARSYQYSFNSVQTQKLAQSLSNFRIKMPVKISGAVSGWIYFQRSVKGWFSFTDYRVEGEITSSALKIEDWEFQNAKLRFGYASGTWYVSQLSGNVRSSTSTDDIGDVRLAGKLTTGKNSLLELSGKINSVKLRPLFKAFGFDLDITNFLGDLTINANVPFSEIRKPIAWAANSKVRLNGVKSPDIPQSDVDVDLRLASGRWNIESGLLTIAGQPIKISGDGTLERNLTYTAAISGSQLSVASMLGAFKQPELASQLTGNVDVVGQVRGSLKRYVEAASAAIRSGSILVNSTSIEKVLVEGVLDNRHPDEESLQLELKSLSFSGGTVQGNVRWNSMRSLEQVFPDHAQLKLIGVDLAKLPKQWTNVPVNGIADGQVEIGSRFDPNSKSHYWNTDAQLKVRQLAILQMGLGDTQVEINKAIDSRSLGAKLSSSEQAVEGTLDVLLDTPGLPLNRTIASEIKSYVAKLNVKGFRSSLRLGSNIEAIPILVTGQAQIEGTPSAWLQNGKAELSELTMTVQQRPIELSEVVVNIREKELRLERFTVRGQSSGRIAGSALIRRDQQEDHLLNLRMVDIQIQPYADLFSTAVESLAGTVNLETRLKKNAHTDSLLSGWQGIAQGQISNIEYRSVPVGQITLDAELTEGDRIRGTMLGRILGGDLKLIGSTSSKDLQLVDQRSSTADRESTRFSASIVGVNLKRLMSIVGSRELSTLYTGIANLHVDSTDSTEGWDIRLGIPSFHFGRQELAREFIARASYQQHQLSIQSISGSLAGGRVDLRGNLQIVEGLPNGSMRFSADDLDIQSLTSLLAPSYAKFYSGDFSYRGQVLFGRTIDFRGLSHFRNALVYSLPIQDAHSDLQIALSPRGALHELFAHNVHGTVIGGRFEGEGLLRGGSTYSLQANGKVAGGKLDQLSRALGFEQIVGTGNFDASTRLTSRDFFNLSALNGPMQFKFNSGDVKSVPVISTLGRLFPVIRLTSTNIESGQMIGQIAQGELHVPTLLLNSDAFYLLANGSASLRSGNLNFSGILNNGGSLNDQVTQAATQKLLATAFPELLLLTQINDLVRNRTLYFDVDGTSKNPVVRPRAAQTIIRGMLQNARRKLIVIPTTPTLLATPVDNN